MRTRGRRAQLVIMLRRFLGQGACHRRVPAATRKQSAKARDAAGARARLLSGSEHQRPGFGAIGPERPSFPAHSAGAGLAALPRQMDTLMQDVRFVIRSVSSQRTFALIAIATLALGIGANTAIFTVVNAVV